LRCSSVAAQGGPRAAFENITIEITKDNVTDQYSRFVGEKFVLMKDCLLQFNFIHFGKVDVEEFDINHWLKFDEVSKTYKFDGNHPNIFPFSLGRRSCPGENIAMAELYVSISLLILNYKFKAPINENEMEIETVCLTAQEVHPKIGVKVERR